MNNDKYIVYNREIYKKINPKTKRHSNELAGKLIQEIYPSKYTKLLPFLIGLLVPIAVLIIHSFLR